MVVQAVAHTALLPEQLTRSVQEEGRHHTALTIPDTIQAVLAARIDRLSSEAKRLLQTVAVIGTAVPLPLVQAAAALTDTLDAPRPRGWISAYLLVHFKQTGEPDHALAAGQRALATAEALGDVDLLVTTQHYLGNVARSLGAYQQAISYCRKNMKVADSASPQARCGLPGPAAIFSRSFLVCNLAECGAFAEARARAEEGVRLAEAADQPLSRVLAYWAVGYRALYQGGLHYAIPVLTRACTLEQDAHFLLMLPRLALYLGAAYTLAGQLTEALAWLEQAVEQALARCVLLDHALQVTWLGEALWRTGRLEEACVQAQHALEFARTHQERGHEAYALRLLGDIAAHRAPPEVEPAEAQYHLALALAEELGLRPLQAHCHHGLGTLYGMVGQWVKAHTALSTAMAMYQAMDMTFWLPQTEAVLVQMEGR